MVIRAMKFQWDWCTLCEAPFIRCPKCGNNSCNGGYGEIDGETCDVCELCYEYQSLAYKSGSEPLNPEEIESFNLKIREQED